MTMMQIALTSAIAIGMVVTVLSGIVSKVPKEDIIFALIGFSLILAVMVW